MKRLGYGLMVVALAATVTMGGCSVLKPKNEAPKLQGTRLDVTYQPSGLQPNPAASVEAMQLPDPVANTFWAQVGGVPSHAVGQLALPQKVVRAWSADLGKGNGRGAMILNTPVIHSGRVFGMDTSGRVTALRESDGKELWHTELKLRQKELAGLSGGLAVTGDLLFVTSGDGQVFCLQASTGKGVWQIDLAVPLRAAPTVDGERLFAISHDSRVFALSALDGKLEWTHSGLEESLGSLRAAPVASANGAVAVPYGSGELYVLRATDGRYIWHDALATPFTGQDPAATLTSIVSPPVIADGIVYAVGLNGGLSAYGLANGERFWKSDVMTSQPMVVAGSVIFALTDKGELMAMNRKDGLIRWVAQLDKNLPQAKDDRTWSGPVLAGGRLIAASNDGYAVSVSPEGKLLAATDLDAPVSVAPVVADNTLYFLTDNARIIAFKGEGTK